MVSLREFADCLGLALLHLHEATKRDSIAPEPEIDWQPMNERTATAFLPPTETETLAHKVREKIQRLYFAALVEAGQHNLADDLRGILKEGREAAEQFANESADAADHRGRASDEAFSRLNAAWLELKRMLDAMPEPVEPVTHEQLAAATYTTAKTMQNKLKVGAVEAAGGILTSGVFKYAVARQLLPEYAALLPISYSEFLACLKQR